MKRPQKWFQKEGFRLSKKNLVIQKVVMYIRVA
jgi:hypothetical protein